MKPILHLIRLSLGFVFLGNGLLAQTTPLTPAQTPVTDQPPLSIVPARMNLDPLETLPIFSDGKVRSFYLFCENELTEIAGSNTYDATIYGNLPALTVITSLWLLPESWEDQPLILVRNAELRAALGLPGGGTRATIQQLRQGTHLEELLADAVATRDGEKSAVLSPLQSAVLRLAGRVNAFEKIRSGDSLLFIPPNTRSGNWVSAKDAPAQFPGPIGQSLPGLVEQMRDTYLKADPYTFTSALSGFVGSIARLKSEGYPDPAGYAFEVWITKANLGLWAAGMMGAAALITLLTFSGRRGWGYLLALVLSLGGCLFLIVEMVGDARIEQTGLVATIVRSAYLLPLGVALVGIVGELFWKRRYLILVSSALAAFLLCLSLRAVS